MATPNNLPAGTTAGWYSDPTNELRQRYWDGAAWTAHTSTAGETPEAPAPGLTTDDVVRAIGMEAKRIRSAVNWLCLFAFLQILLAALWIFGAITVTFEPAF